MDRLYTDLELFCWAVALIRTTKYVSRLRGAAEELLGSREVVDSGMRLNVIVRIHRVVPDVNHAIL